MGLIPSATTVTVQAKLTDKGREVLFNSIEDNNAGFITKFGIGDSDANYKSIGAGSGTLESGHVPEVSDFAPIIRSFALYDGMFRPGVPVLLIGEDYGPEIVMDMSVGSNDEKVRLAFVIKTEWPKNTVYDEGHIAKIQNPGNLSDAAFKKLFTIASLTTGQHILQFNGGATEDELDILLGTNRTGSTTIIINLEGAITGQNAIMYVEVKQ